MENIIEGLQKEMNRCRELLLAYESIGPAGTFAKTMIQKEIEQAEKAIASGDTIQIMRSYAQLESCN